MTQYLISFSAHAMDHLPDEDMAAVGKAAHAVVQEAVPIAASGAPSMSPSGRARSRLCASSTGVGCCRLAAQNEVCRSVEPTRVWPPSADPVVRIRGSSSRKTGAGRSGPRDKP
jgi:hypothetical protein